MTCPGDQLAPRGRPVHVIDDDDQIRGSLAFLLTASGANPHTFEGPEEFFDQLEQLAPGPIMLDMRMAGMDGLEVLARLRDQQLCWPVITMSAHGDIAMAVKAIKLGAIEFLEKPFKIALLDSALAMAFDILDSAGIAADTGATATNRGTLQFFAKSPYSYGVKGKS